MGRFEPLGSIDGALNYGALTILVLLCRILGVLFLFRLGLVIEALSAAEMTTRVLIRASVVTVPSTVLALLGLFCLDVLSFRLSSPSLDFV